MRSPQSILTRETRQSRRLGWGIAATAIALVVLGGQLIWGALHLPALRHDSSNLIASRAASDYDDSSRSQHPTKPIEDIRVGDRVVADNPDIDSAPDTAVDPETWRKVRLRAETRWDDGTLDDTNVETLQPLSWIEAVGARVGLDVPLPLDLLEMGLPEDLNATVLSIESSPPIRSAPGRVVLTTVDHLNRHVLEITVGASNGSTETIRPTGFHKFYRPSDLAWVSAEALRPGDQLQGISDSVTVVSNRQVPGTHRVYNLTVEGEHVYNVSRLGVLVHNANCTGGVYVIFGSDTGTVYVGTTRNIFGTRPSVSARQRFGFGTEPVDKMLLHMPGATEAERKTYERWILEQFTGGVHPSLDPGVHNLIWPVK